MRNVSLPAAAVSVIIVALAAQVAFAQGAPPPPAPPPPAGSAAPGAPPTAAPTAPNAPTAPPGAPTAPPADSTQPPPAPPPPAPPPPVPPPPPTGAAPVGPPAVAPVAQPPSTPAAAPQPMGAAPEADKVEPAKKPPASVFGIEVMGGLGGRANSTSSGYTDDQRGGLLYGGGLFFAPNRRFAVGLSYQRQVGAQEQFEPGATLNSGKINRTYQSVLANLRAYPLRNDSVGLWGGLMIGAMFQTANATGTSTPAGVYASPSSYSIDAGPSGGMALGLGVGMDYDVSNSFGFLASVNMLNAWLKSDSMTNPPDRPVPGAGSVMMLDARVAFQYRFDTSGAALPVSGTVKTSKR